MNRLLLAFLCLAACIPGTTAFGALEIKETKWGFNEKAVPGRFNLLSVRVAAAGAAFDGELAVHESRGGEGTVGAPVVQPLYVTAGTERWVQFSVFISNVFPWELRWGRGPNERLKLDGPKLTAPPTVLLFDSTSLLAQTGRIRAFPEDLFPPGAAAIDALGGVALDHTPRWDAPRREAFLDWLRAGGTVHILREGGEYPAFEGGLAVLNTIEPSVRLGLGTIVRHDVAREGFDEAFLKKAGFDTPEFEDAMSYKAGNFHESILRGLASLTRPEIAWWLIYLLTLAYLVLIGPMHYLWAKRLDYRISLCIFGGTVTLFALAFIVFGRRGAGEVQISHSLSLARFIEGNRLDTMQWISAFATDGDTYKLTHEAPVNIYSATSDTERVNGRIVNGRDGFFTVDIPLYSSRPFMHRAVMTGPDLGAQFEKWDGDGIVLRPGSDFPKGVSQVRGRIATGLIEFRKKGAAWEWSRAEHVPKSPQELFETGGGGGAYNMNTGLGMGVDFEFRNAMLPLIRRVIDLNAGARQQMSARELAKDEMELFIFAPQPKNFGVKGPGFDKEKGWVLYVRSFAKPQ